MVTIRSEKPEDHQIIYEINHLAFNGEFEARLVEKLRKTDEFLPDLSLVAVKEGKAVGHILFSVIQIRTESKNIPVLALAPVAVLPEYQNQGIGSLLIREGIKNVKNWDIKRLSYLDTRTIIPVSDLSPPGKAD